MSGCAPSGLRPRWDREALQATRASSQSSFGNACEAVTAAPQRGAAAASQREGPAAQLPARSTPAPPATPCPPARAVEEKENANSTRGRAMGKQTCGTARQPAEARLVLKRWRPAQSAADRSS